MHKINHANIKEWAANYDGPLFDGILCDPPYELGFMGKSWDSSGIAFDTEMWADLFKLLKPGAHLLAFSGSRTYHRMAVAIEDAGFEIRDMIEWVYGSGFPKSLNIGKAVDKIQGNEREVVGINEDYLRRKPNGMKTDGATAYNYSKTQQETNPTITKGTSEWEGYGTALKPAHEPCVLARKPIEGTVANNVLKHGTGGLNIDGTRVQGLSEKELNWTPQRHNEDKRADENVYGGGKGFYPKEEMTMFNPTGRFPANLIHDGSDEVEAVFPQTGKSSGGRIGNKGSMINTMGNAYEKGDPGFGDSGSASRYFKVCKDLVSDTPASCSEKTYDVVGVNGTKDQPGLFYTAKASKSERNAGLEGFEEKPTAASNQAIAELKRGNSNFVKENATSGYSSIKMSTNHHPTVKPLSLTKYLATLIKPPTGGRLLVPFSGSGSEMIGALQAGWEYVEGVELTEEYIPIAEARIKHWVSQ